MRRRIVLRIRRDQGRTGLAVPEHELAHVPAADVGKTLDELLDGGGFAIVAFEIQIHTGAEFLRAEQGVHHAHHFRALFVNGAGVEVVDFLVLLGPYRVR